MAENINYQHKRLGTNDAEITFGEVDLNNVISGVTIRVGTSSPDGVPHYFRMDKGGDSYNKGRRGTIFECPGTFEVNAGQSVREGIPGVFIDANNGDIIFRTKGRIRFEAENIDMIAEGADGENGVININASEKIIIDSKQSVLIQSTVSTTVFSENTVEVLGNSICNIYGGLLDFLDGASTIKGSRTLIPGVPATPRELIQQIRNFISGAS